MAETSPPPGAAPQVLLIGRILQHYRLLNAAQFESAARDYAALTATPGPRPPPSFGDFLCERGLLSADQARWLAQAVVHFEAQLRRAQSERAPTPVSTTLPTPTAQPTIAATAPATAPVAPTGPAAPVPAPVVVAPVVVTPVVVAPVALAPAHEPVVHTSMLPVLTPVEPASVESVPATSETTLQSEASSVGSVNSGGSAMSGWGAQGSQVVAGTGLVSLSALQQITGQSAPAATPDLSAVSVEILSAGSSDNSWNSLPMVEVETISTLSERPPGEEGTAVWGNLPLAVALATRPAGPVERDDGPVLNPWNNAATLAPVAPPASAATGFGPEAESFVAPVLVDLELDAARPVVDPVRGLGSGPNRAARPEAPPPVEPPRSFDSIADFQPDAEQSIHRLGEGRATEALFETRPETRVDTRVDTRIEARPETRIDTRVDTRIEARDDVREVRELSESREPRPAPRGGATRVAIGVLRPGGARRRAREGKEPEAPRRALRSEETPAPPEVERLLLEAQRQGASDLHLHVGAGPLFRIDGELRPVAGARPVTAELTEQLLAHALTLPERRLLREGAELTFAAELPGVGRFRAAVLPQPRGWDLILRPVSGRLPPLEDLGLPAAAQQLAGLRSGLVLCVGPAGSGKTTTLAALVQHLIQRRGLRVLCIEDPIEHHLRGALQRQVGLHSHGFARALRTAQAGDFDVVALSAIPDAPTLRHALELALSGCLVLAGICTGGAQRALEQLLELPTPATRAVLRGLLAQALGGVIAQRLVRKAEGRGRVIAAEVLLATPGVASLIREDRLADLRGQALRERVAGMHFLDESLLTLVRQGAVSAAEARAQLQIPGALE